MVKTHVTTTVARKSRGIGHIELELHVEMNGTRGRTGTVVVTAGDPVLLVTVGDGTPDNPDHICEGGYTSARTVPTDPMSVIDALWSKIGPDVFSYEFTVETRISPWASAVSKTMEQLLHDYCPHPKKKTNKSETEGKRKADRRNA